MQSIFNEIQYLSGIYGPTRLMAYGTAILTTVSVLVVSVLLWLTRNEDKK